MRWSHSSLTCILSCPMTFFLRYKMGINTKAKKPALEIGSAVHWGIEHNTEDLSEYYAADFRTKDSYGHDQLLAEAMVHGYMKHKDELFKQILFDPDTGEQLELVDEIHELSLVEKLKSFKFKDDHDFKGIIDLLLIVKDKNGQLFFIIIDYKTSSRDPNYEDYLEQIYRYIFLLSKEFPDIPIKRIGIINIKKTGIRQKSHEPWESYLRRLKFEYDVNDENYVKVYMYEEKDLDKDIVNSYIDNLSKQTDLAATIETNNLWYINYGAAVNQYGKTDFYDIFYKTRDCYVLYDISDKIYNPVLGEIVKKRDCRPCDMLVIDHDNVLNKYEKFKMQAMAYFSVNEDIDKDKLFSFLKKSFITDDLLLSEYWDTLEHEIETESESN